jgi:acyl carrier protein
MSISSLPSTPRATDIKEGFIPTEIRAFIAAYIGADAEHITDAMHLLDDLELDKLDRLELLILIEELTGVEFTDDEADQIEVVGDVARYVASGDHERAAAMILSGKGRIGALRVKRAGSAHRVRAPAAPARSAQGN